MASGVAASLSQPGGNLTGMTSINRELAGKRLELLRNFAPRASRVAILWDERNSGNLLGMDDAEAAAKTLGLTIRSVPMRSPEALDAAVATALRSR